ncbi:methylated-DNA--[protein]-cysteine S-methyltransferase [Colwellia sp. 1_MG-2023]|uniref:methylated-DNA--[protein]-cysteine S-methyltransferase n=1 Tax=unclassified Colwellia TaxID=196834 RepID=UPI001C0939F2|nr:MULTISPECIES: methylated-DNA--[protein]-cysteine S-methyltransferase [unclassified Colwellia]MBU2923663.1 methylated-DNA--[protein]-cysteine S-methyltransferase [Colwellia sp. C2M11]MDO6652237.1 methylated-DNA--[protein]-cysteine S-methyltransferase [Colwellia sp. 3_MG-2023]MDO6664594.1 methylated-DNA--[protein]-cysteine S-methyltransferase [Colwellia sp. 2_MG-2023]MDO6688945.1 methylated-DNA--[protein]-cysteine S-methyltransferase [Colwellia sp. 1_MG-2023]
MTNNLFLSILPTPLGDLAIFSDHDAIYRVKFTDRVKDIELMNTDIYQENEITLLAKKQLSQYFDGKRSTFNLPLAPQGTSFRQQAWQALQKIPYGETRYYSEQAELMDNTKAVRAVGAANGANPISIIIPCHRVIGKDGSLTGYAGGLERKAWLLNLEQKEVQNKQEFELK